MRLQVICKRSLTRPIICFYAESGVRPCLRIRRFTRLTNAFSKKLENQALSVAPFAMYCNFVRIHKTLKCSPAMAARISKTLWSMDDIVALIDARAEAPNRPAIYKKRETA